MHSRRRFLFALIGISFATAVLAGCPGQPASPSTLSLLPEQVDLARLDYGLAGFADGFTDGRYAYLVPHAHTANSGKVAGVDLKNFSAAGAQMLDLEKVDSGLTGFLGGFTDGKYGYFVPNESLNYSGKLARVDLGNFAAAGVTVLDLEKVDSGLKGFWGGFTDGKYGYLVPNYGGEASGKLARIDLQNFTAGGVTVLNLQQIDPGLTGFAGGFTNGKYGYLVPKSNPGAGGRSSIQYSGKVVRVDLQQFGPAGVTVLDLAAIDGALQGFWGGFTDGKYAYLVPNYNGSASSGKLARIDLQKFEKAGVTSLDLATIDKDLVGFGGGFTDGRYGYLVPRSYGAPLGKMAVLDLQNFSLKGVSEVDLGAVDAGLKGFWGGFTDGKYGYLVPNHNGSFDGVFARFPLPSAGK